MLLAHLAPMEQIGGGHEGNVLLRSHVFRVIHHPPMARLKVGSLPNMPRPHPSDPIARLDHHAVFLPVHTVIRGRQFMSVPMASTTRQIIEVEFSFVIIGPSIPDHSHPLGSKKTGLDGFRKGGSFRGIHHRRFPSFQRLGLRWQIAKNQTKGERKSPSDPGNGVDDHGDIFYATFLRLIRGFSVCEKTDLFQVKYLRFTMKNLESIFIDNSPPHYCHFALVSFAGA